MKRKILPRQKMSRTPRENGDITTARIIEAAGQLFAERGYAETMNKDIAKRANVALTSINYHFGSREVLYETVIQHASRTMLDPSFFKLLEKSTASAGKKLESVVDYITDSNGGEWQSRWQTRLWARETVTPSSLWLKMSTENIIPRLTALMDVLSDATGIPGDAPDLEICFLNMLAPAMFMLITNQSNQTLRLPNEAFDKKMVSENMKEFILAGIERTAQNYKKRRSTAMTTSAS